MRPAIVCSLLASAFAGLALPASAEVIVVDQAGGGDFMFLDMAIAAAADGDTLLVRPGFYLNSGTGNFISGRSLVIAADGTGEVLTGQISIVAPGEHVVLRGLTIKPDALEGNTAVFLLNSDVFIEGCTIHGLEGHFFHAGGITGGTGVTASGTGNLVLKDCVVEGGRGADSAMVWGHGAASGGHGVTAGSAVTVAIHGGSVTGGAGGDDVDGFGPGGSGGNGVSVGSSFGNSLLVAGCTVTGGEGGDSIGSGSFGPDAYAGGDGVFVSQMSLSLLDATLVAGAAGQNGSGQPGSPGEELQTQGAPTVVQFAGAYRSLVFGAPAPEGSPLTLAYEGAAGDLVGMFVSTSSAVLPGKQGLFHLGAPLLGLFTLGPAGPSGTLALSFGVPNLGFGPSDAVTFYAQALVKPASGATLLSSPTTALLIDNSL